MMLDNGLSKGYCCVPTRDIYIYHQHGQFWLPFGDDARSQKLTAHYTSADSGRTIMTYQPAPPSMAYGGVATQPTYVPIPTGPSPVYNMVPDGGNYPVLTPLGSGSVPRSAGAPPPTPPPRIQTEISLGVSALGVPQEYGPPPSMPAMNQDKMTYSMSIGGSGSLESKVHYSRGMDRTAVQG